MNFEMTTAALIGTFALIAFAYYKSKQPKPIGKAWSVPWMAIIFLSVIIVLVLINHLVTLRSPDGKPLQRPLTRGAIDAPAPSQDFARLSQRSQSYSIYRAR